MGNYLNETIENILEAIKNGDYDYIIKDTELDEDEKKEALYDDMWINDSITGNASGSYYFNSIESKEMVLANRYTVIEALEEFCNNEKLEAFRNYIECVDTINMYIGEDFEELDDEEFEQSLIDNDLSEEDADYCRCLKYTINEEINIDFEFLDVTARCYVLSEAIEECCEEINFN